MAATAANYGRDVLKMAADGGYISRGAYQQDLGNGGGCVSGGGGGDCCFCFCPGGCGSDEDSGKACLALAVIAALATSLVSLGFTVNSTYQAVSYASERSEAEKRGGVGAIDPGSQVYQNARTLLDGMVKERSWTTLSLAAVTLGTALLTIAAIIALVTHPYFGIYGAQIQQYAIYGAALVGAGLFGYAITQGYFVRRRFQEDATALQHSIDHPQRVSVPRSGGFRLVDDDSGAHCTAAPLPSPDPAPARVPVVYMQPSAPPPPYDSPQYPQPA